MSLTSQLPQAGSAASFHVYTLLSGQILMWETTYVTLTLPLLTGFTHFYWVSVCSISTLRINSEMKKVVSVHLQVKVLEKNYKHNMVHIRLEDEGTENN